MAILGNLGKLSRIGSKRTARQATSHALKYSFPNSAALTAGAVGVGAMAAMGNADLGTYSMDYMEDALLGTTNADEVYTGGQRSITAPFSARIAPLGYMSAASGAYQKAMDADPASSGQIYMRSQQRQRTYNQAIDGSMVFGMWNLRR